MTDQANLLIHIPEGINYSCTGCGKCCGEWSVPLTATDYLRISAIDWASDDRLKGRKLFAPLNLYEKEGLPFTHVLVAGDDGYCPFLKDHLCSIHATHGEKAKPQTCQLFPYTFTETPTGAYATVSMVSMAAMYNVGTPLTEQSEVLTGKLSEYRKLMSAHKPDWSKIQMIGGQPLAWEEYIEYEAELLKIIKNRSIPLEERLRQGSNFLTSKLTKPPVIKDQDLALKKIDRHLLSALHKIYLPPKPPKRYEAHFNVLRFLLQMTFDQPIIQLKDASYTIDELHKVPWDENDKEIEDFLFRYFYQRIFGKFYFGGGFAQISLVTGYHHLVLVYALIKLHSKAEALSRESNKVSLLDVAKTIRLLEKYLGQTHLSGYTAATYELLMFSPQRIARILANT